MIPLPEGPGEHSACPGMAYLDTGMDYFPFFFSFFLGLSSLLNNF